MSNDHLYSNAKRHVDARTLLLDEIIGPALDHIMLGDGTPAQKAKRLIEVVNSFLRDVLDGQINATVNALKEARYREDREEVTNLLEEERIFTLAKKRLCGPKKRRPTTTTTEKEPAHVA